MQYTRLIKKAGRDLINGRGDWKTNVSKIMYYGTVQNFIFNAMQKALFTMMWGEEEDPCEGLSGSKLEKCEKTKTNPTVNVANGMLDTILKGSGLGGAVISTIKNALLEYNKQEAKGFTADHGYTLIQLASLSPPIGSKMRKVYTAIKTEQYDKDVINERVLHLDSPAWSIIGNLVGGFTNIPLDRVVKKANNVVAALDERNAIWQRLALVWGWAKWDVNAAPNEMHEQIKIKAKEKRKQEGIEKGKITRKENKIKEELRLQNMSIEDRIRYDIEEKRKKTKKKIDNKRKKDSLKLLELNPNFFNKNN